MKKYIITSEFVMNSSGTKLFRIKALKDFNYIRSGDLGGFIQSESNLSQEDNCWVLGNARVFGYAEG